MSLFDNFIKRFAEYGDLESLQESLEREDDELEISEDDEDSDDLSGNIKDSLSDSDKFQKDIIDKVINTKNVILSGKADLDSIVTMLTHIKEYVISIDYLTDDMKNSVIKRVDTALQDLKEGKESKLPNYILECGRKYYVLQKFLKYLLNRGWEANTNYFVGDYVYIRSNSNLDFHGDAYYECIKDHKSPKTLNSNYIDTYWTPVTVDPSYMDLNKSEDYFNASEYKSADEEDLEKAHKDDDKLKKIKLDIDDKVNMNAGEDETLIKLQKQIYNKFMKWHKPNNLSESDLARMDELSNAISNLQSKSEDLQSKGKDLTESEKAELKSKRDELYKLFQKEKGESVDEEGVKPYESNYIETLSISLTNLTKIFQKILYYETFQTNMQQLNTTVSSFEKLYDGILQYIPSANKNHRAIESEVNKISDETIQNYLENKFGNLLDISTKSSTAKLKKLSQVLTELESICDTILMMIKEKEKDNEKIAKTSNEVNQAYDQLCSMQNIRNSIWFNRFIGDTVYSLEKQNTMFRALMAEFSTVFIDSSYQSNVNIQTIIRKLVDNLSHSMENVNSSELENHVDEVTNKINLTGINVVISELSSYFTSLISDLKDEDSKNINNILNSSSKDFINITKSDCINLYKLLNSAFQRIIRIINPLHYLKDKLEDSTEDVAIPNEAATVFSVLDYLYKFRDFVINSQDLLISGDILDINEIKKFVEETKQENAVSQSELIKPVRINISSLKNVYNKFNEYMSNIKNYNGKISIK